MSHLKELFPCKMNLKADLHTKLVIKSFEAKPITR